MVGQGLIYTLDAESTAAHYIGYQIVVSIGTGLTIQVPIVIAQSIFSRSDVSIAVSMVLCKLYLGCSLLFLFLSRSPKMHSTN